MKRPLQKLLLLSAASLVPLPSALACSVCYGEPDSPMTRGLTWAIIALGGIVGAVLSAVAGFFVHVNRRTTALAQAGGKLEHTNLRS